MPAVRPGAPRLTHLPELLEVHLGEIQTLWTRRRAALHSAEHTASSLGRLDERLAAHTQGALAAPGPARALALRALAGTAHPEADPDAAFAAAHVLLRLGDPDAARAVARAFPRAAPPARRGLADALAHGPAAAVEPLYAALAAEGAPGAMAAAAEVLAFRGALGGTLGDTLGAPALDAALGDHDAEARAAGWRAAALLGARVAPARYAAGWRDHAPEVRRAALEAAAWAGADELLAHARAVAARPPRGPADALYLLAALAGPDDAPRVAAVAAAPGAPPARLALLGPLGSPAHVDRVVAAAGDSDPATAAAAAAAFARLTGHDVRTGRRASLAPPDADPFDAAFADEVRLPDPARARALWDAMRPAAIAARRLAGGVDVGGPYDPAVAAASLDLASRREWALRSRRDGTWGGGPADLQRLAHDAPDAPETP